MKKYILKRISHLIPVVLGVTFLSFFLIYISPGDAAVKKLSANGIALTQEVIEQTRIDLGLNRSFLEQYIDWLMRVLIGDFGTSYRDGLAVFPKLLVGLSNTFVLTILSLFIAVIIAVPLGMLSALYPKSKLNKIVQILSIGSNALPNFLIATILVYVFCIQLKVFPIIAKDSIHGLFLPAISLAFPIMGRFMRQIKVEMLSELNKSYVQGLQLKGLKRNYLLVNNVLRNALPAIVTLIALSFSTLLGGAVITEVIFNWKGIGNIVMTAILYRDYPVIQGFVFMMGIVNVMINLMSDIIHKLLDYRVDIS